MDEQKRANREAFKYAHQNRIFEIEMFWKRSLVFWGFISAAFIGFAALAPKSHGYAVLFSCFGFICSLVWALGNKGSKYWQEYWEIKVTGLQENVIGDLFVDRVPRRHPWWDQFAPRRKSVSKLVMGLSDFSVVAWLALLIYSDISLFTKWNTEIKNFALVIFSVLTILYSIYMYKKCDSED